MDLLDGVWTDPRMPRLRKVAVPYALWKHHQQRVRRLMPFNPDGSSPIWMLVATAAIAVLIARFNPTLPTLARHLHVYNLAWVIEAALVWVAELILIRLALLPFYLHYGRKWRALEPKMMEAGTQHWALTSEDGWAALELCNLKQSLRNETERLQWTPKSKPFVQTPNKYDGVKHLVSSFPDAAGPILVAYFGSLETAGLRAPVIGVERRRELFDTAQDCLEQMQAACRPQQDA